MEANFTNQNLNDYFCVYGKIKHAYLIYDMETRVSKCFGYVHFETEDSAKLAISYENSKVGNQLIVQKFDPNFKAEKKTTFHNPKKDSKIINSDQKEKTNVNQSCTPKSDSHEKNSADNFKNLMNFVNQKNELEILMMNIQLQKQIDNNLQKYENLKNVGQEHPFHPNTNNTDLNCCYSNKRWVDYIGALNKQKQFQLFNSNNNSFADVRMESPDSYKQYIENLIDTDDENLAGEKSLADCEISTRNQSAYPNNGFHSNQSEYPNNGFPTN